MMPEEMKTRVVMGMKFCLTPKGCPGCPYAGWTKKDCINQLIEDALAVLEEKEEADHAGT